MKVINEELKAVKAWLESNKLSLNFEKTNLLTKRKIPEDLILKFGKNQSKELSM